MKAGELEEGQEMKMRLAVRSEEQMSKGEHRCQK
jgi:hypothetical protein